MSAMEHSFCITAFLIGEPPLLSDNVCYLKSRFWNWISVNLSILLKLLIWLTENKIKALNIAGPRESNAPGIYEVSMKFLVILHGEWKSFKHEYELRVEMKELIIRNHN